jgi:transposase InsO family protein
MLEQDTTFLCQTLGYSRQTYYQQKKRVALEAQQEAAVLDVVRQKRSQLPRIGGRKLHYLLAPILLENSLKMGRDALFKLLKEHNLLIPKRRTYVQTTNSSLWRRQYPDLTRDFVPTAPEQLWVSDITYIKTEEGYCYLTLLTDAYSRQIVGHSIDDNMETATVAKALKQAIKQRVTNNKIIHHSDRGNQYCSAAYKAICEKANIIQSTTQDGNPYHNALAERMNRTLKEEFCLDQSLPTKQIAIQATEQAIYLYNNLRPHLSLNFKTPNQVHKNSLKTSQ